MEKPVGAVKMSLAYWGLKREFFRVRAKVLIFFIEVIIPKQPRVGEAVF
jgi:hypothetical protein